MANAAVDKLKDFGIRHGEKIVVGLVSVLCVVLIGLAFVKPTIELTPTDVQKVADQAQSNINRQQSREEILAKLESQDIKATEFLKLVEERKPGTLSAEPYRLANAFTSPEPGAGLIRDMPELIAPENLVVHFVRGSTEVYELDKEGNRVYENPDEKPEKKTSRKRSSRASAYSSMMRGGMGAFGEGSGGTNDREDEATKKAREKASRRARESVAGDPSAAKKAEEETPEEPQGEMKKSLKGIRAATILAELDNKRLRENYSKALKLDIANTYVHYLRLDVQRQQSEDDGSWPEKWQNVNREETARILDNVYMQEEEFVPEENRIKELVDLLPYLNSGYWRRVHLASLVDAAKLPEEVKAEQTKKGAAKGGRNSGRMSYDSMMRGQGTPGGAGYGEMMRGGRMGSGASSYEGMMRGSGGMMGVGMPRMGGGTGGGANEGDFTKSEAEKLMVRALDFSVEPDSTYRFRIRIVVYNPNYHREDVSPGVDTKTKELAGPWSDPSDPVTIPADVATYIVGKKPLNVNPTGDMLEFRVARWDTERGLTILKPFDEAPGQIIGTPTNASVPNAENSNLSSKTYDFTSHQLLLDSMGGDRSIEKYRLGTRFDAPASALVMRPDGTLVLRDEAHDVQDGQMAEMKEIYDQTLKDVNSGKSKSSEGGMPGMPTGRSSGGGAAKSSSQ